MTNTTPDVLMGPAGINWLASLVADGTATPNEANELLVEFVRQADSGRVHPLLIEHMRACINSFLVGRKVLDPAPNQGRERAVAVPIQDLEKAFGLTRVAPGGPRVDDETLAEVAMQVLERRLAGEPFLTASDNVADERRAAGLQVTADSHVRKAWATHQAAGYHRLRLLKAEGVEVAPPWTASELAKLVRIFKGKVWFAPPHVDAKARRDAILAEVDRPGTDTSDLRRRVATVIAKFDALPTPKNRRRT